MTTPIEVIINGRDNTQGAFASAGGGLAKIGQIAAGILTSQVFTRLASAAVDFGKSVFNEAMDAQLNMAQLDAVLKSTGGQAGVTREAALDLADSFQKVTRYSDDTILQGENMLLTFTNIGKDVFPQATEAILNMSTGLGQDLQSSAIQLGKALNDPVAGVTALQRVGVKLTEAQKKQVEAFMKVNDIASAQKVILGELQTEFGGSAEAAGKTFAGSMDILKNKFNDMKEGLGLKLLPVIQTMMDKLSVLADNPAALKFFDDMAAGAIKIIEGISKLPAIFDSAGQSVNNFVAPFIPAIQSIMSTFEKMRPTIENIVVFLQIRLGNAMRELSSKVFPFLVEKLNVFAAWFTANRPLIENFLFNAATRFAAFADGVVAFWAVVSPILSGAFDLILNLATLVMQLSTGDWAGAWESMKTTVSDAFTAIGEAIVAFLNWIAGLMGSSLAQIGAQWSANWNQFKLIVVQVWTIITTKISSALSSIKSYFSSAWSNIISGAMSFASNLISAIVNGINNAVSGASAALSGFIGLGSKIIEYIITGLNNAKNTLLTYLQGIIKGLVTGIFGGGFSGGTVIQPGWGEGSHPGGGGMASGTNGWRTVPPGYPNDSYPIRLQSGEQFAVIPAGQRNTMAGGNTNNNYYNAHITIYTGKTDPQKLMRGFV